MSTKKNRNHSAPLNITGKKSLTKTNEIIQDGLPVLENVPHKIGITSYLKTRWYMVALVIFLTIGTFGAGLKYIEDSARRDTSGGKNIIGKEESLVSKLNTFSSAALPAGSPTPLPLSKEYIYAGSRLLAVEDANASAAPPADLAVWRPGAGSGVWWVMGGSGSQQATQQWGTAGDKPVPGDYDGDGKTDFAIFRPDAANHLGSWYILYSASNAWTQIQWGHDSDIDNLTPADFDGDGRTDIALWRPANGGWYILKSSDNQALSFQFGSSGDKPAPADYDGDGKADVAVWRSSNSTFYSIGSSNVAASQTATFSQSSTEPVSADYDGDGKADFAIRSGANWITKNSSNGAMQTAITWQSAGDKAVHNDYDGDGKVDIAVWKDATGSWYIRKSSNNQLRQEQWGQAGDIPVPAFYRR